MIILFNKKKRTSLIDTSKIINKISMINNRKFTNSQMEAFLHLESRKLEKSVYRFLDDSSLSIHACLCFCACVLKKKKNRLHANRNDRKRGLSLNVKFVKLHRCLWIYFQDVFHLSWIPWYWGFFFWFEWLLDMND